MTALRPYIVTAILCLTIIAAVLIHEAREDLRAARQVSTIGRMERW
jgi:hypothetical protein